MFSMEQIKAHYPNPSNKNEGKAYCIGGAVCLFMERVTGYTIPLRNTVLKEDKIYSLSDIFPKDGAFPGEQAIAKALTMLNPALDSPSALVYAREIVKFNNMRAFHSGWQSVKAALQVTQ